MTTATDRRIMSGVGREARLDLSFEYRQGQTVLAASYAEPPFRIPRTFPEGLDGRHVIMTSSAPGIFGGDSFVQSIGVGTNAHVRLSSQSALQVHPSPRAGTASFESCYRVASGGHLRCAWDASIPFAAARLDQRIRIDLEDSATLFWSDAVMSGRNARGERWAFDSLAHQLRVCRNGSLVYLERYDIDGDPASLSHPWLAGDATYFGTVLAVGNGVPATDSLHRELAGAGDLRTAVDRLADEIVLVRLASRSGPAFHEARNRLAVMTVSK